MVCAKLGLTFLLFIVFEYSNCADFIERRLLGDGEMEVRIRRRRISATETRSSGPGLRLWQVTDGKHFIQSIYDSDFELKDCEYVKDPKTVEDFLRGFSDDSSSESSEWESSGNYSLLTPESELSEDLRHLTDYPRLKRECRNLHRKIRIMAKNALRKGIKGSSRSKREMFIYPGTNWCGVGTASESYNQLGWNAAADRCCRQHDHCPFTIEGFVTKFNFFNYRFHTISHCDCDERFRSCLKMANNDASNMVGKVFFNVVQMKCFVLKKEKTCVKRSWWGKCLKSIDQKTASVRDSIEY